LLVRRCPAGLYGSLRHFVMIIRHAAVWINSAIVQWRLQTMEPVNLSVLKITSQLEMEKKNKSKGGLKEWASAWKLSFHQFLNCRSAVGLSVVSYWQSIRWNKLGGWPSFPLNSFSSLKWGASVDFQLKFYSSCFITLDRLALHKHTPTFQIWAVFSPSYQIWLLLSWFANHILKTHTITSVFVTISSVLCLCNELLYFKDQIRYSYSTCTSMIFD